MLNMLLLQEDPAEAKRRIDGAREMATGLWTWLTHGGFWMIGVGIVSVFIIMFAVLAWQDRGKSQCRCRSPFRDDHDSKCPEHIYNRIRR